MTAKDLKGSCRGLIFGSILSHFPGGTKENLLQDCRSPVRARALSDEEVNSLEIFRCGDTKNVMRSKWYYVLTPVALVVGRCDRTK